MRAEHNGASRKYSTALVFLVAGTLLGVWHNRRVDTGKQDLVSGAVRTAVAPPAGAVNTASHWLSEKTGWLFHGKEAADENAHLKERLALLEEENARLREADIKLSQLKDDLGFVKSGSAGKIPAAVISQRIDSKYDTLLIGRGSRDGVHPHSVVVTRQGLVGQVTEVTPTTATVVLITEQNGGVGARVQRAASRTFGICKGDNAGVLWMYHLPNDANIKKGDIIVSSGMGEVFPAGVAIGTVADVKPDEENVNKKARLIPSVAFDRLEDVYVLP